MKMVSKAYMSDRVSSYAFKKSTKKIQGKNFNQSRYRDYNRE